MSLRNKAVFIGVASAFVLVFGCGQPGARLAPPPGQHYGQRNGRGFNVYIYTDSSSTGQFFVDLNVATLWKNYNQTVRWISDDGGDYIVKFDVSNPPTPFSSATFTVPKNGQTPKETITGTPGYYQYEIYFGNGTLCKPASDPGFYVK